MSDFFTRLVQRQQGRLSTVQPRVPTVFGSVVSQDTSMPEALASEPPMLKKRTTRLTAEEPSTRLRPTDPAQPVVTAPLLPMRGRMPGDLPSAETPMSKESDAPRGLEGPVPVLHRASNDRPGREPTYSMPSNSSRSNTPPAVEARLGSKVAFESPLRETGVELPPRLVTRVVEPHQEPLSAPTSMLSTELAGRQSGNLAQEVSEPPVQVTIGRIEVTALTAPSPPKRKAAARPPSMSLHDYLTRRQGGKRE